MTPPCHVPQVLREVERAHGHHARFPVTSLKVFEMKAPDHFKEARDPSHELAWRTLEEITNRVRKPDILAIAAGSP